LCSIRRLSSDMNHPKCGCAAAPSAWPFSQQRIWQ
jgi:hypothetical protein